MAADTYDGVEAIAGAIGFWGQTAVSSVTDDGEVFEAVNYVYVSVEVLRFLARRRSSQGTLVWVAFLRGSPLFSAMQSVTSAGNNTFYMVGYWLDSWNSTDGDVRSESSTRSKRRMKRTPLTSHRSNFFLGFPPGRVSSPPPMAAR